MLTQPSSTRVILTCYAIVEKKSASKKVKLDDIDDGEEDQVSSPFVMFIPSLMSTLGKCF